MNRGSPTTKRIALLIAVCLLLVLFTVALAQSGGNYDLVWGSAVGGGGASGGGDYMVSGTAGQAAAGVMTGGAYSMTGGVTGGGIPALPDRYIFLPLVAQGK